MTHAPSHLIALGRGRVRVLRLFAGQATYALRYTVEAGQSFCRVCGCTETYGCSPQCGWVDRQHTLCSRCLERMVMR